MKILKIRVNTDCVQLFALGGIMIFKGQEYHHGDRVLEHLIEIGADFSTDLSSKADFIILDREPCERPNCKDKICTQVPAKKFQSNLDEDVLKEDFEPESQIKKRKTSKG
jgi:hypothetical protein